MNIDTIPHHLAALRMPATQKRQRVSIACVPCRKKKRRCDGQKPVCQVCEREDRECEYTYLLEKRKPPTKCYIHALHSRIAFLEHQLATTRHGAEQSELLTVGLGSDEEDLKTHNVKPVSHSLSGFGRNFQLSGAYGLFCSRELDEQQQSSSGVGILENVDSVSGEPLFLFPDAQSQLLDDFWTWRNTWPVLVHEPLFKKDLTNGGVKVYATPTLLAAIVAFSSQCAGDAQLSMWGTSGEALAKHAKSKILAQIEYSSLSLVLAAAIIALRELAVDNLSSASQYIGIAFRHSLTLGLHIETPTMDESIQGSQEVLEARSLAWWGVWLLEKHISQILGQPSALRDGDMRPGPVPILPSVEYRLWPVFHASGPELAFSSLSNLQYACKLVCMVSPILDEIHALASPLSIHEKEEKATKTHVAMSEFYNNLPSHLRLPATATTQLSPPVYQFNLLYHNLKIMLHRPFFKTAPSMHDLDEFKRPEMVHIQSATFSAIRITSIVNAYRNFYPLETLSPFAVHSLATSSLVHLLNANSADATLSQRTTHLYRLNLRFLGQMSSTNYGSNRAIKALTSLECEGGASILPNTTKPSMRDRGAECNGSVSAGQRGTPTTALDSMNISGHIDFMENAFDWFQLPLNDQLVFDDVIESSLWEEVCESYDPMGGLPPLHRNM
ncbi:Zn(II)2Cys6 transcription factor [Aspergillus tubingensis]|nr:fungal-specific transcription factor domain-domain-containing protein [Aspergillus tubingensis]GFN19593.1 fungal-specific transcription factor domain-domain-containing protein [Aspergillus tubingensis]